MEEMVERGTLLVYKPPGPGQMPTMRDVVGKVTETQCDGNEIFIEVQDIGNSHLAKMVRTGMFEVNPVSVGTVKQLPDGTQVVEDAEFKHMTLDPAPPSRPRSEDASDEEPEL